MYKMEVLIKVVVVVANTQYKFSWIIVPFYVKFFIVEFSLWKLLIVWPGFGKTDLLIPNFIMNLQVKNSTKTLDKFSKTDIVK